MSRNLSSAVVVIDALRVNPVYTGSPLMGTFTNSEDTDEMLHKAAFKGAQWLRGVAGLSLTALCPSSRHLSLLSTGSTQEDSSLNN